MDTGLIYHNLEPISPSTDSDEYIGQGLTGRCLPDKGWIRSDFEKGGRNDRGDD
jgi:hypothetical protein